LLLAVSPFVVLSAFVDVLLTVLQHAIDESGESMRHGGDGFRGPEPTAQTSVTARRGKTELSKLAISHPTKGVVPDWFVLFQLYVFLKLLDGFLEPMQFEIGIPRLIMRRCALWVQLNRTLKGLRVTIEMSKAPP
jgi:hypothetical protein